ncbi:substrate-binding domain-containing protein [Amycolatopsis acidiphila]|uniref:Sugar ABC transporter substrate-binding protein n=1 Tax=Amycolatopsis acidiphila TaxID=715473 RepID=A0A558A573_9PSEU|nr:substrate-binding domain-containing protein [Amycolatopsis acidiphila]TVT19411.1 sugar ABC transporter substrate-binding protein [Amycolatopsis acidiphila]UIJ56780.1 substrate-binding domain-containing protein [Amycolatopsis acidiphila]GHG55150.1 sugar ABC transporter substrate-binding protein [Amycolatopsis acidiphila]
MSNSNRRLAFVATLAAAALAVTGCSSGGGKQAEQQNAAANAGTAGTAKIRIAMITHETPGDTFWDIVRKGAQAAAAKDNVDLVYSNDPAGPNQANLVQNAVDQKVDGIAMTLAHPDAMTGVIGKAKAAGIPVVGFNAGIDNWAQEGLLEYFGSDETIAGQAFGDRLNQVGAKHALCVIHEQGQVALEARCAGLKQAFKGQTELLYVNGQDATATQSTIQAKLQQDKGIDFVATLGAPVALLAVQSVTGAGSSAKVATFDTNKALVQAIKDGTVQWAVDQQPYLQGYLAVDSLWLYKFNGNTVGGGKATLTGPAFITKDNIDSVSQFANAGTR